ncbi:MAG: PDZ domain-containing protein [Gemmataceae bacterium]|nr:PDZ domain-containing protein [Gemmataceae bacterium]
MQHWHIAIFAIMIGTAPPARAQLNPQVDKVEKTVQKVIQQSEAAIACILVSRSDAYQRVAQNGEKDYPGKLGTFDPFMLKGLGDLSEKDRILLQKKLDLADPNHLPQAFGSGVVIDRNGYILTNYHVVQDATKIFVRLPGGKGSYADIHAADPRSDLAMLKVLNAKILPLKAIPLGDADQAQRGQFIVTLANPYAAGFHDGQPSASLGILSNIRRRVMHGFKEEDRVKPLQYYSTLLQTDARLHLGSSGGALLNLQGEMIGLITALAAIQGGETPGGFAIPVNSGMRRIIDVLKRGEEIDYGFLGVGFEERPGNDQRGIMLSQVGKGTPADLDGKLKDRDVLIAVNGKPINTSDDIFVVIGTQLAGTKVRLQIVRGGQEIASEVTLGKLYVPGERIYSSTGSRPMLRGMRVDYASLVVQKPPRWFLLPAGVLVSEMQPNSPAARAGLKTGDVITRCNDRPVTSPAAFYDAMPAFGAVDLTLYQYPADGNAVKIKLK